MTRPAKTVAYLAHPVGAGESIEDLERRQNNIANTLAWLQFLVDVTSWSISVPWLPYVMRLDEGTYRARGIEDDLAGLERCDILVGVGGRWSDGMTSERARAVELGLPVIDLTSWGFSPPSLAKGDRDVAEIRAALGLRAHHASALPRRAWLPPLDANDLDELRANRATLIGLECDFDALSKVLEAASKVIAP